MYSDEHYQEQARQQARWAREDALQAQRRATAAAMRGNRYAAIRYNDIAARRNADAEYIDSTI